MTLVDICWRIEDIQRAAPVGVEALTIGDPIADAIFVAVHQTVPVGLLPSLDTTAEPVAKSERDLLNNFLRPSMDEPLLLFITGAVGTGKSHMVRWLRSAVGARPEWHTVYIKKNDTSLTRVILEIIRGIDSQQANSVRERLQDVTEDSRRLDRMVFRFRAALDELVSFDEEPLEEIRSQEGVVRRLEGSGLDLVRRVSKSLLGEAVLADHLQRVDGPLWRIVQYSISREGKELPEDFDERALLLQDTDLEIGADVVADASPAAKSAVKILTNHSVLRDVVLYLNSKLGKAKKDAFTGRNTNVVALFEDVRKVIAERGQELCLFVEDLVVLNGIDLDLAQALTIPAGSDLCRVRAAIAVTSGFLNGLDTLRDRGVHYTMDVKTDDLTTEDRRAFVAKYLNAGRVGGDRLRQWHEGERSSPPPNACTSCARRAQCHETFGASVDGHGYFPFNGPALDYLVGQASKAKFWPRNIVREVVRNCTETADTELRDRSMFPSQHFGANLDQPRRNVPAAVLVELRRKSSSPEQEISLRNFYSIKPPVADEDLKRISDYFGVSLTDVPIDDSGVNPPPPPPPPVNEFTFEKWFQDDKQRVPADEARSVRNWIFYSVANRLRASNCGYLVTTKSDRMSVGGVLVSVNDVVIQNAAGGGGGVRGRVQMEFKRCAEDAVVLQTILSLSRRQYNANDLGVGYFQAMDRVAAFEERILAEADVDRSKVNFDSALQVLRMTSLANGEADRSQFNVVEDLLRPPRTGSNELLNKYIGGTKEYRNAALVALRSGLVAAKGTGTPSVLDVGPIFRTLTSTARRRSVGESPTSQMLEQVADLHRRFAGDTWSRLRTCCNAITPLLDPGENLSEVMSAMADLVQGGAIGGVLSALDAAELYQQACAALAPESMDLLRFVLKQVDSGNELESIWELPIDAQRKLEGLRDWAREADKILAPIEALRQDGGEIEQDDRVMLVNALESLADQLEEVAK